MASVEFSRVRERIVRGVRHALPLVLVTAGCALILIMLAASWTHSRYGYQAVGTVRTNQAELDRLQNLLVKLLDAETGTRGYLVTHNEAYLEPLRQSEAELDQVIASLRKDFPVGSPDHAEFKQLLSLIAAEREILRKTVEAGHLVVPVPAGGGGADKAYMDQIRFSIAALQQRRASANERLVGEALHRLDDIKHTVTLLAVGGLGLLIALFAVQQRQSNLRERLANLLADENARLESMVDHRTRELSSLATYLTNAREAERARLARELHDELGALLTAAKMDAGWLQRILADGAEQGIKDRFKRLIDSIGSGITVKRRIIDDLRPPLLQGLGLVEALRALSASFSVEVPVNAKLPDADLELDEEYSLALFRIAQEALTNIRKYARAKHVELGLKVQDGHIHLWVVDDGVGFRIDSPQLNRHGLAGMQHRVQMFAGVISIRSSPGYGTRIEARMPLPTGAQKSS